MDKISNTSKVIAAALVVVIIIVVVFIFGAQKGQSPTNTTATNQTGTVAGTLTTATGTNAKGSTGGTSQPAPRTSAPFVVHLVTPVANAQWTIGGSNPITWDRAGTITGEIDLLDAKGNFIGVILSESGTGQTSYSWNARDYELSRYSPLKKEVVPGTYKIRISFDGNNLASVTSPIVTINN
jgi:hypothetical protein